MAEFKGTPHNTAKLGEIAKTVLMPGDPLRAKYVAETFLENAKEFNHVRGILGYTGTYKGREISVMAHGMGIPSVGIYSYELFKFYDVDNIIRFGSAGALDKALDLFDVVIVDGSYSLSTYAREAFGITEDLLYPSSDLVKALEDSANAQGKKYTKGIVSSSDVFYSTVEGTPCNYELLCAEMESFGLFATAQALGKKAACILTISDVIGTTKATTAEERQLAFRDMMEIALDAAISL